MRILSEFCIKPDAVTDELKIGIEIKRVEKICNAKIAECRSMVVKQFGEMGKISSKIAEEIKMATNYELEKERCIFDSLTRNEIYAHDVIVINNRYEMPEVTVYIKRNLNNDILNKIAIVTSRELNRKMQTAESINAGTVNSSSMLPASKTTIIISIYAEPIISDKMPIPNIFKIVFL